MNIAAIKFNAKDATQNGIVNVSLNLGDYFLASFDKLVPANTKGGAPVVYDLTAVSYENGETSLVFKEVDAGYELKNLTDEQRKAYEAALKKYGRKTKLVGFAPTGSGLIGFAGRKPNADTEVKLVYPVEFSEEGGTPSSD